MLPKDLKINGTVHIVTGENHLFIFLKARRLFALIFNNFCVLLLLLLLLLLLVQLSMIM